MANFVITRQLDGVTPFELFGRNYGWFGSNGNLERLNPYVEPGADTYDLIFALSGNVRIRSFEVTFWNPVAQSPVGGSSTTITDANDSGSRRIDFLRLADGTNTVTLTNTVVETITAFFQLASTRTTITQGDARIGSIDLGMGNTTVNGGNNRINSITLGTGNDIVNAGGGSIEYIRTEDGNDRVTGGSGAIGAVFLGKGNDRFTAGTGLASFVDAGEGNDTIVVGNGGRINALSLGTGNDTVQLSGNSLIESLRGYGNATVTMGGISVIEQAFLTGADVRVTMENNARVFSLKTGEGTNRITTANGYLESYHNFNGTNILTIGAGGAGQITLAGSAGTQTVNATGFVQSLQVTDASAATVTLRGGADFVSTGTADDRVTTQGTAFVGTIRTREGNDVVTLGPGGAQTVNLGAGDDTLSISAMDPALGIAIVGGAGVDTLDMSRIAQAVFVDLSQVGTFQNFGRPDGQLIGVPGAIGYLSLSGMENLTGTAQGDRLTGRETANLIDGGGGNDILSGLAGNDTLNGGAGGDVLFGGDGDDVLRGGRGNDTMTGGAGADEFLFARADGTDRITDFELGADKIGIAGVTRLGQITFSNVAAGVRMVANETTIIVEGVSVSDLRVADNFLF